MTESQIRHMVNRFLGWRLPEDFHPDAGISFKPEYNENTPWPAKHEPTGTNLFNATQAEAMVRYMIDGMADQARDKFTAADGWQPVDDQEAAMVKYAPASEESAE